MFEKYVYATVAVRKRHLNYKPLKVQQYFCSGIRKLILHMREINKEKGKNTYQNLFLFLNYTPLCN